MEWLVDEQFSDRYKVGFLLVSSILWGTSFPAVAFGLQYMGPELLLFTRFFLASAVAVLLFPKVIKKSLLNKQLAMLGTLNGIAYFLQFFGQQWVLPGLSSLLVNAYAILVPFTAYLIVGEKITLKKIIAAFIGLTGVGMVSYQDPQPSSSIPFLIYLAGVIIVFAAGVTWATYVTLSKKVQSEQLLKEKNSDVTLQLFVASLIYSAMVAFVTVIIRFIFLNQSETFKLEGVAAALYLGIFCTVIPFLLYFNSLQHMDVGLTTIILLLEVAVSYFISILYFGEVITPIQLIGVAFIAIGVWIAISESEKGSPPRNDLNSLETTNQAS